MQFISDVHADTYSERDHLAQPPERVAPILALLGDVGSASDWRTEAYIYSCCEAFDTVIWVPGNHEYWPSNGRRNTVSQQMSTMRELAHQLPNLVLLQNESMRVGDYIILGTTLWSHVPINHIEDVENGVADYWHLIDNYGHSVHAATTNFWHRKAVSFLKEELSRESGSAQQFIILSHHPPLTYGMNQPRHESSRTSAAYTNSLAWLIDEYADNIHTWAWGHTHWRYDRYTDTGIRLCSNPAGYKQEDIGKTVNPVLF